jgi:mannosyltransferase
VLLRRLAVPLALFAVALGLGLFRIGAKSIWYDEAVSIGYATSGLVTMLRTTIDHDLNGLLYHALLVGWVQLFGAGEGAARALSALMAAASVPLLYAVGCRVSGRRVAVGAALLLAASQPFIAYAQEARMYAFALLASVLLTLLLLLAVDGDRRRWWLAYGIGAALGLYVHLFVGLVVASHFLWLGTTLTGAPDRRTRLGGMLSAGVIFLAASVPMLGFAATHGAPSWISQLSAEAIYWVLEPLAGRSDLLLVLAGIAAIVVAVRVVMYPPSEHRDHVLLVLMWGVAPIVLTIVISIFKPLLVARYLIVVVPAFALLGAMATLSFRGRFISTALFTVLLGLTLWSGLQWYTGLPKDNWRLAVQSVSSRAELGDYVVFYPPRMITPFDYYRHRLSLTGQTPPYSSQVPAAPGAKRVWLVMRIEHGHGWPADVVALRESLVASGFKPQGRIRSYDGVDVQLFSRGSQGALLTPTASTFD